MIDLNVLKQAAEQVNIADSYISAWGIHTDVKPEVIEGLLASLGYDTSSDEALLASVEKQHKSEVLEPVYVLHDDEPMDIGLHLAVGARV